MSSIKLRTCVVWGDLAADSAADQYPEVPVCEDCIQAEQKSGEDSQIVSVGGPVSDKDATCHFCDSGAED
jgi:hypothetical protein